MANQMFTLLRTPGSLAGALFASALLMGVQASAASIGRPGAVNYTEGDVTINGQQVKTQKTTEVGAGQVLETGHGKAEMLLTPGVFLRLGDNSAARMISPSLTDTRVELLRGKAMVEAADVEKENHLDIVDNGATTQILKHGLYAFNADQPAVAVYDGKAQVQEDDHAVDLGKGKEVRLPAAGDNAAVTLKPQKFDKNETDNLYAWSKLRSKYLAEANQSSAQMILAYGPSWYYGTGWYWNPYFDTWAFVPGAGFMYSPFGFGFYSPAYLYSYPPAYYHYGYRGFRGGRIAAPPRAMTPRAAASRPAAPAPVAPAPRAPAMGGGGVRFGGVKR